MVKNTLEEVKYGTFKYLLEGNSRIMDGKLNVDLEVLCVIKMKFTPIEFNNFVNRYLEENKHKGL